MSTPCQRLQYRRQDDYTPTAFESVLYDLAHRDSWVVCR